MVRVAGNDFDVQRRRGFALGGDHAGVRSAGVVWNLCDRLLFDRRGRKCGRRCLDRNRLRSLVLDFGTQEVGILRGSAEPELTISHHGDGERNQKQEQSDLQPARLLAVDSRSLGGSNNRLRVQLQHFEIREAAKPGFFATQIGCVIFLSVTMAPVG